MSKVFARLKITESRSVLNFSKFSYIAIFVTVTGRAISTQKITFETDGLGREAVLDLKKNERPNNTTVHFKIFLPSGTLYNPDIPIHGHTYAKGQGLQPKLSEYALKLFSDQTVKEPNNRIPNRRVLSTYPVPDGLRMVAYLREPIKFAAQTSGIEPHIIASIVFQEKFHGVWAYRKNLLSYVKSFGVLAPSNSYGYGEMQLGLAGELLGIDKSRPDWLEEVFVVICTDAEIAMDLVAKNILRLHRLLGRKATYQEATIFNNASPAALDSYHKNEIPQERIKDSVYGRSWNWQNAIKIALTGDVIAIPDDTRDTYRADPEYSTEKWVFDPSLKLAL